MEACFVCPTQLLSKSRGSCSAPKPALMMLEPLSIQTTLLIFVVVVVQVFFQWFFVVVVFVNMDGDSNRR